MSLAFSDILVIIIYFIIVLYIGFFLARKQKKSSDKVLDFILAGRKITLPLFVGTLVATWYGNILGVGEFIYKSGILAWVCFGLPYYFAAAFFAYFIAKKIRQSEVKTIPEQMVSKYGKKAGWLSSIVVLIITIPAAYILMLGVMIQLFTGWQLWFSVIIGAIVSLAYLYSGGFKSDILTNSFQFILMYVGFGALLYFSINNLGSISLMFNKLPNEHKSFFGNASWQYVLSWYIISFQTFIDPSFHQRCASAESPKIAKNGILISIFFWMIFDSLTLITGLYAKAYINISDPMMAFPSLGEQVLPAFWKGIFIISLLATIMSTLDSYSFISAVTIGNDILLPLKKFFKSIRRFSTESLTRFGLTLTAVLGIILALFIPSAIDLIYKTASIAIPGLLIPLLLSFSKKYYLTSNKAILILISASGISFIWTILKIAIERHFLTPMFFLSDIEPMIPGIVLSLFLGIIFSKKYATSI